jgi:hypothetical protein
LVGSFSAATELVGKMSSILAAKTLLKGESAERREFQIIQRYRRLRERRIRQRIPDSREC